jgi:hypothetical protein
MLKENIHKICAILGRDFCGEFLPFCEKYFQKMNILSQILCFKSPQLPTI